MCRCVKGLCAMAAGPGHTHRRRLTTGAARAAPLRGHVLLHMQAPNETTTFALASKKCTALAACKAFTFNNPNPQPAGRVDVSMTAFYFLSRALSLVCRAWPHARTHVAYGAEASGRRPCTKGTLLLPVPSQVYYKNTAKVQPNPRPIKFPEGSVPGWNTNDHGYGRCNLWLYTWRQ